MLTGINPYDEKDYISKLEKDMENPTIFKIGVLDARIKAYITDLAISGVNPSSDNPDDDARIVMRVNEWNYEIVRFGLRGVENFIDPQTKKPAKFETVAFAKYGKSYQVVSHNLLSMMPSSLINELADEIRKSSQLLEEEAKN